MRRSDVEELMRIRDSIHKRLGRRVRVQHGTFRLREVTYAFMKWLTIEPGLAFVSTVVAAVLLQKESAGVICVAVAVALNSGFAIGADAKRRYLQKHDRFDQEECQHMLVERPVRKSE